VVWGLTRDERGVELLGDRLALIEVVDEHQRLAVVVGQQLPGLLDLPGVGAREDVALAPVGVLPLVLRELVAPREIAEFDLRLGDEAGVEQRRPVRAERRADEGVDIRLVVALADGGGGETEAVFAL